MERPPRRGLAAARQAARVERLVREGVWQRLLRLLWTWRAADGRGHRGRRSLVLVVLMLALLLGVMQLTQRPMMLLVPVLALVLRLLPQLTRMLMLLLH